LLKNLRDFFIVGKINNFGEFYGKTAEKSSIYAVQISGGWVSSSFGRNVYARDCNPGPKIPIAGLTIANPGNPPPSSLGRCNLRSLKLSCDYVFWFLTNSQVKYIQFTLIHYINCCVILFSYSEFITCRYSKKKKFLSSPSLFLGLYVEQR